MDKDKDRQKELSILSIFDDEPVQHASYKGKKYWSGTKNNNPNCLKNRVAQDMEP